MINTNELREKVACSIFAADFGSSKILPFASFKELGGQNCYNTMADNAMTVVLSELITLLPVGLDDPHRCPVKNDVCCGYHSLCATLARAETT